MLYVLLSNLGCKERSRPSENPPVAQNDTPQVANASVPAADAAVDRVDAASPAVPDIRCDAKPSPAGKRCPAPETALGQICNEEVQLMAGRALERTNIIDRIKGTRGTATYDERSNSIRIEMDDCEGWVRTNMCAGPASLFSAPEAEISRVECGKGPTFVVGTVRR